MGLTLFKRAARKDGADSEFAATVASLPPGVEASVPLPPVGPEGLAPDSLPPDSQLFDSQPFDSRPFDSRPPDSQGFDTQPPDSVPFGSRPYAARAPAPPAREAGPFDPHPPQDLPAYLGGSGARTEAGGAAASALAAGSGAATPGVGEAAASLAMADQPTIAQVGRYALKRHLGLGGLGQVHEAWDPLLSRTVAIKTLQFESDPRTRNSLDRLFLNEARAVAGLSHPNIVTVYDAGLSPQGVYLAMERLHGLDLRQRLAEGWKPGPAVAAQLVRRVADALAYAHARGVVHCDIKPGNIFIASSDKPKVLDFGIARVAHRRVLPGFEGMVAGSPHFLAPEQLLGKDVDARTDVYSLGVVFYELLSGRRAFAGDSVEQITTAVLTNHPAPAHLIRSGVPEALSAIAARAMARDPEARYATASEMAADIRGWFEQPRTPSASPSSLSPPPRAARAGRGARAGEGRSASADGASAASAPTRRSPWAIAGLVMAVLGGLGIALALTLGPAHKPAAVPRGGTATAATTPATAATATRGAPVAGPGEGELVMSGGVPVMPPAAAATAATPAAAAASVVSQVVAAGAGGSASAAPTTPAATATSSSTDAATTPAAQSVSTPPGANAANAATSGTAPAAGKPTLARNAPAPGARTASVTAVAGRDATGRRAASATVPAASAAATGTLQLAISPWGQVEIDGSAAGTTPPLTQLTLPTGTHTITIRNADFPAFTTTVQVQADKPAQVRHRFGQ